MTTTLHTFAKGDPVRLIDNQHLHPGMFPIGKEGTIDGRVGNWVRVDWGDETNAIIAPHRLEKIQSRYEKIDTRGLHTLLWCKDCGCYIRDQKVHDNNVHWDDAEFSITVGEGDAPSHTPTEDPYDKVLDLLKELDGKNTAEWRSTDYHSSDYWRFASRSSLLSIIKGRVRQLQVK